MSACGKVSPVSACQEIAAVAHMPSSVLVSRSPEEHKRLQDITTKLSGVGVAAAPASTFVPASAVPSMPSLAGGGGGGAGAQPRTAATEPHPINLCPAVDMNWFDWMKAIPEDLQASLAPPSDSFSPE